MHVMSRTKPVAVCFVQIQWLGKPYVGRRRRRPAVRLWSWPQSLTGYHLWLGPV